MRATLILLALAPLATLTHAQTFTCAKPAAGQTALTTASLYIPGATFGFDQSTAPATFDGHSCSGDKSFFFSAATTDGAYRVTVILGGSKPSTTTIKAEARRLYVDQLTLPAGASRTVTFLVHVRTPLITGAPPAADKVRLKPREIGAADWDDRLTLEFSGIPSVRSITITPITGVPTIYLAGDSTVVNQENEPWAAWGQMIPIFFNDKVVIANEAESGETTKSFIGERRLAKIESTWHPGDFLLVQFAHNDQKAGAVSLPDYKDLLRRYIAEARAAHVTPILVTAMNRRSFTPDGKIVDTLGGYPQATREIAAEQHTPLIDLNAASKTIFEALGDAGSLKAFVHYPANTFPNQPAELKDDTHFNAYGAYLLAQAVIDSIAKQDLPIAKYLVPGIKPFDPTHPMPPTAFHLPPSPTFSITTPYGDSGKIEKK